MADRYIIELTDRKYRKFWEELLAQLDFVIVKPAATAKPLKKTRKEAEFQEGLREALQEVKDDLSGKRKMQSAKDFLHELRG